MINLPFVKKLKAIKIIREKLVNVNALYLSQNAPDPVNTYNILIGDNRKRYLTLKEYVLLVEVLL